MQTRTALRRLGGGTHQIGDGPLADIRDQLVEGMQTREAARMEEAHRRAEQLGAGPHLQALQRLAREYSAQSLRDNTAPAIMRADFHELLKSASQAAGKTDRGLARATVHAYRLWSKDPAGSLTVGEVASLRDHYKAEFPKSRIAKVIDAQVPKVGFNTLPVARLTRIAADISRHAEAESADLQAVYEGAMRTHGFDANTPECIRARAFVRGLLDRVGEEAPTESDVATRTASRLLSAQLDPEMDMGEPPMDLEESQEEDMSAGETEYAQVDSPITGEPMMLELETEERAEDEGELGENAVDVMPGDVDRLEYMGQLEDLGGDDNTIDMERGDIPMGPESAETTVVITDPTDPEGGELEVTLKPIESEPEPEPIEGPEEPLDAMGGSGVPGAEATVGIPGKEAADKCAKCASEPCECEEGDMERDAAKKCDECDSDPCECKKKAFAVYAYSNGKRAAEPIDRFEATGMAAALRHIASQGVRGEVRSTANAVANEALIVLNAERGEYLQVTAEASAATNAVFEPKINEQQPAAMSGPTKDDGGGALKSDNMGKQRKPKKAERLSTDEVTKRCAALDLTPESIEHRVLDGEIVKAAGWSLEVNEDADIELKFSNGVSRTASLVHMDDIVSNFMAHVAQASPEPQVKQAHYDVTELFAVRCAACGSVAEYPMPEEPADANCGQCGFVTTAQAIAQTFADGNPTTGYVLVTDVPEGDDPRDRTINAKRILAAIQKVLPTARGLLRKDAKLQVDLEGADEPALNRVRRVLEGQYGVKAFSIDAQAVPQPAMDAQGDPQQDATNAPAAEGTYVGPPQQQTVQPGMPQAPQMQPAQTGAPAQQQMQQGMQPQAAFVVHYKTASGETGEAPVEASSENAARSVFARFNDDVEIVKVEAQFMPAGDPMMAEPAPGEPEMGGEDAPMPLAPQVDPAGGEMGMGMDMGDAGAMGGGSLAPDEQEAVRAALTHYRNQGLGPVAALDQLNSQYRELIDRYGEKTDHQRHLIEAEAMKLAAEVWMKPAVLDIEAARKKAGDLPMPGGINTQQPDAVQVSNDLGRDSDHDDSTTNSLEAPKINTQVKPQGTFSDTSTAPDSDNNDPGDFGAGKPKAQHPATDQQGTSLSDTNLGKDSDTGDDKSTKKWESVSKGAPNNVRSK